MYITNKRVLLPHEILINFRKGKKVKKKISKTRFNIHTFGYFFPKLKNLFKDLNLSLSTEAFKELIIQNLRIYLRTFLKIFSKYDLIVSTFLQKKAKSRTKEVKKVNIIKKNKGTKRRKSNEISQAY